MSNNNTSNRISPEDAFSEFNALDINVLDSCEKTHKYAPLTFWKVTNAISRMIANNTDGRLRTKFTDIKDGSPESLEIAGKMAIDLCRHVSAEAQWLRDHLFNNNIGAEDKGWGRAWTLQHLAICLGHFGRRNFDDASLAFYVAAMTRQNTLDDGFILVERQYDMILEAVERRERDNADTESAVA